LLQDFASATADVNHRAKQQEALGHRATQSSAASRNENALVLEQVWLKDSLQL
jgi:hypothetical protein